MTSDQMTSVRPLDGVRVIDMGRLFAAPWAGQLLGDLGADVIKVERAGSGDEIRFYGPPFLQDASGAPRRESTYSYAANRNKRSITADLSKPEGRDIIRRLIASADIVIENFKVGDLARYQLDYAALRQSNPGLIYCSITGFGQTGPRASAPATDAIFQAMSGMMSITGEPDGEPQRFGVVIVDLLTGVYAATAIMAALRHREVQGGQGQYIDLALFDVAMAAMSHRATEFLMTGASPIRKGSGSAGNVPARNFRCSDGVLCVQAGGDPQFAKLCRALGREDWIADPRFSSRAARVANERQLNELLEAIFATDTTAAWNEILGRHEVYCGPLNDVAGAFADPQAQHRRLRVTTTQQGAAACDVIANPIRMSQTPIRDYSAPPSIGQHTDDVLAELGLSPEHIDALRKAGAV